MNRNDVADGRLAMANLENWDSIRELVRQRNLIAAVEALEQDLKDQLSGPNQGQIREWLNELVLHISSIRAVQLKVRRGLITKEDEGTELQQISYNILNLIDEVEREGQSAFGRTSEKRVLFLASNPIETDRVQLDEEIRLIKQRLDEAPTGRQYEVVSEWAVRITELSKFLLQYRPTIVHFSGHGSPTGDIILLDDTGKAKSLAVEHLANLFDILKGSIECIVLNACYSIERANLLVNCVGCVVGMDKAIGDLSAVRFSGGFYRGIAFAKDYEEAFRLGCNEIDLASLPDSAVPHFVTRNEDRVPGTMVQTDRATTSLTRPQRTWIDRSVVSTALAPENVPRVYPVWFGTDREPNDGGDLAKGFSCDRAKDPSAIYFGMCDVVIPKAHKFGSVGSSWWKRFVTIDDDRLILRKIRLLQREAFWSSARDAIALAEVGERMAFVFIHGFRVTFEEAALRAAQIGFDLKVPGIMAFFSWPSKGRLSLFDYTADEASIEASTKKIATFLTGFAEQTNAEHVHVIAHSMGNRGLLRAMHEIIDDAAKSSKKPFRHLLFAAPDVDAAVFCELAKNYGDIAEHATLYVSSRDRAIASSGIIHDAPRAGFVPPVTLLEGIDTVEVSNVDLTLLGHGYYGSAEGVLYDMRELLVYDAPAKSRTRVHDTGKGYWQIGK
jgi:esterase/lipase superfamily enzyme